MLLTGDSGSSFDRRLDSTETGGVTHDLHSLAHTVSRFRASNDIERDDAAEAGQMLRRHLVSRVGREAGITHLLNPLVRLQSAGDFVRRRAGGSGSQRIGPDAARSEERLEGAWRRAAELP